MGIEIFLLNSLEQPIKLLPFLLPRQALIRSEVLPIIINIINNYYSLLHSNMYDKLT